MCSFCVVYKKGDYHEIIQVYESRDKVKNIIEILVSIIY